MTARFTEDAVFLGPTGVPMQGRDAIAKFYANAFKQNLSETAKAFEIHALGDNAWGIGEYDAKLSGPNGPTEVKGHWAAVYVPVGGEWKVVRTRNRRLWQRPAAAQASRFGCTVMAG
jgi:ketosteroid isomerase-like protein